jgi:thiol:disulfide interchange protein
MWMRAVFLWLMILLSVEATRAASTAEISKDHIRVSLLTQHAGIAPGAETWLALRMRHEAHWHTYWEFPGESGLPTLIKWTLPPDVEIGPLHYQAPIPLEVGGIHNVGFEGESWVFAKLKLKANSTLRAIPINAAASWLICKEECIPGDASFELQLPVIASSILADHAAEFEQALAKRPKPETDAASYLHDAPRKAVQFRIAPPADLDPQHAWIFIADEQLAATAQTPIVTRDGGWLNTRAQHDSFVQAPDSVRIVVRDQRSDRAWEYLATHDKNAAWSELPASDTSANPTPSVGATGGSNIGFAVALAFAFGGGIILNLMPCVLPVLSIKLLSLLEQSPAQVRTHAAMYSLGVWLSFMAIGALLAFLRARGAALGWGFQLQSPIVVSLLALLMFALGLSLSGLVQFGTRLAQLSRFEGDSGSAASAFGSGVLACIVASPCTAPLMAPALGYAMAQPTWISLSVLSALAAGFAAPMLCLTISPGLARFLPKPGQWMQTLKYALAVPLYLSAIWLLWIFGQQRSVDALALMLIAALCLAIGLVWREHLRFDGSRIARTAAVALIIATAWPWYQAAINPAYASQTEQSANTDVPWQKYSERALNDLRSQNQAVLVEMTAAWCVTCKVNEKVAMSGADFAAALQTAGVIPMKGDWTNRDAAITRYLESFGVSGVPLVVVYRADGSTEVLPQVLTPGIVRAALQRASKNK